MSAAVPTRRRGLDRPWRTRTSVLLLAAAVVLQVPLAVGLSGQQRAQAQEAAPGPFSANVPKPECQPGDVPETGLQGQVPMRERVRGFEGFNCNLTTIGHFEGEGAEWQHARYGDCAYYDTANQNADKPTLAMKNPGTVVLDMRDPTNPVPTAYLTDPAMLHPWESLKVNEARGLLAGVEYNGTHFSVYDLKADCRNPVLLATIEIPDVSGHAGEWAPDGNTYFGTVFGDSFYAIDTTDPRAPRLLLQHEVAVHDLTLSPDGKVMYVANATGFLGDQDREAPTNGLKVLDVSELTARAAEPAITELGSVTWADGSTAQWAQAFRSKGRDYVMFADELGPGGITSTQGWAKACAEGLPPYGRPRIIDVSEPSAPRTVTTLTLEVHDPANCAAVIGDTTGSVPFGYDSHYCNIDDVKDATAVACGQFESGVRVYDIRDIAAPREIAYVNPPMAKYAGTYKPGSNYNLTGFGGTSDWCASRPMWVPETAQLWFTCHQGGFYAAKFAPGLWPQTAASAPPAPAGPAPAPVGQPAPVNAPAGTAAQQRPALAATGIGGLLSLGGVVLLGLAVVPSVLCRTCSIGSD